MGVSLESKYSLLQLTVYAFPFLFSSKYQLLKQPLKEELGKIKYLSSHFLPWDAEIKQHKK